MKIWFIQYILQTYCGRFKKYSLGITGLAKVCLKQLMMINKEELLWCLVWDDDFHWILETVHWRVGWADMRWGRRNTSYWSLACTQAGWCSCTQEPCTLAAEACSWTPLEERVCTHGVKLEACNRWLMLEACTQQRRGWRRWCWEMERWLQSHHCHTLPWRLRPCHGSWDASSEKKDECSSCHSPSLCSSMVCLWYEHACASYDHWS